jgi:hypothetical protein
MHIPTAPHGPATLTAAQIRHQLATDSGDWDNRPVIPKLPHPTRSPEQPKVPKQPTRAYDDFVLRYGEHAANSAF